MRPEVWGPHAWMFLHSITLEYPDEPTDKDKQDMITFIGVLGDVLPCKKCRINFKTHVDKYPLDNKALESKKNLVKWLIDIHNCVNGVKQCKELSYEDALQELLKNYNNSTSSSKYIYIFIFILFIIFCLVIILLV